LANLASFSFIAFNTSSMNEGPKSNELWNK
jgi:hypothetical protein